MQEIRIGRLNGAFVACWWEENGKRRRFRLKSKTRQEAISEALRVKDAQRALEGHHLTFQDLKDNYSKYLGARRTAHQVEEVWKCMGPALGGFRVDQIDDDVMESFLVERQRQAMERRGRPLSNGTLWTDVNIAQSIFNYAKK